MNTHPILFSTPMVQAILEGRKTMTRRIVKFKPFNEKHSRPKSVPFFDHSTNSISIFPYGKIGDILWVKETFTEYFPGEFEYKAGFTDEPIKWKPSIFMPKAAARIFLKITDIRVERLQDMSREDCKKEGVLLGNDNGKFAGWHDVFRDLWEKINGPDSWVSNPWVWVISFERCEKPENF
jgi:hypothetical protein